MPIIRKKLASADVHPDAIRYNPTSGEVEVLIDGEWVESPEADPRNQTTLPPRVSSNPRCDGAQSVADAIEGQISAINGAIDGAQTAAQIAALILGLFSFGVFAIFINIALAIANAMLSAGTAAIEAALPGSAYDELACILYCNMDANGRVKAGNFTAIQNEITAQIGGLGATTLNQFIALAGEGGINNLASLETSTGSCAGCDCGGWCYEWIEADASPDWILATAQPFGNYGYLYTNGWGTSQINHVQGTRSDGYSALIIKCALPVSGTITKCEVWTTGGIPTTKRFGFPNVYSGHVNMLIVGDHFTAIGNWTVTNIGLFYECATLNNPAKITKIRLTGTGSNPFGEDNCV